MIRLLSCSAVASITIVVLNAAVAFGQWANNPKVNNLVSASSYSYFPAATTDGAGGAIIAWTDYVSGSANINAKRITHNGVTMWGPGDASICADPSQQKYPTIVSDGSGGAIIAWEDRRNDTADVYAQHIDGAGIVQWTTDGISIVSLTNVQEYPIAVSDGAGGAIIAWTDGRDGTHDIYAQRVDNAGDPVWAPNGVAITKATGDQWATFITSDGSGGAIVAWYDNRNGTGQDIYTQRIDASGAAVWTPDGVALTLATGDQYPGGIMGDGKGGAVVTWNDNRTGSYDIFAQKIDGAGTVYWADGQPICTDPGFQYGGAVTSDGAGGFIVVWADARGGHYDIYGQRIDWIGNEMWTNNGIPINTEYHDQLAAKIFSDNAGGAIVGWGDYRNGNYDFYAQRIDGLGSRKWTSTGVPVATAPGNQLNPVMVSDGANGLIVAWEDERTSGSQIYAQNVDPYGFIGDASPHIVKVRDVINDQGGKVSVLWKPSYLDDVTNPGISYYYIYRGIKPSAVASSTISARPDEYDNLPPELMRKTYLKLPLSITSSDTIYWEWVGTVNIDYLEGYSFNATTMSDSGPQGIPWEYFMVRARSYYGWFWNSNVDSAYSADNLPPGAVQSLTAVAQPGPTVKVHWPANTDDPDVGYYETHRSAIANFTPGTGTKIGQSTDSAFTDFSPLNGIPNYYKIVTVDVHGNRSLPSPEASLTISGVEDRGGIVPAQFALEQNYPNPFNPSTIIRYQLPASSHVSLKIYDMLGREIATLIEGEQSAGYKSIEWDSRGVPSGTYILSIRAGDFRDVKSMMIVK